MTMPTTSASAPRADQTQVVAPVRVLLADEDEFLRWVLDRLLGEAGYDVSTADTGHGLLALLARSFERDALVPQVLVASARLPDMSGLCILERLHAAGWRAPFILLAEAGDKRAQERAWRCGASYLLCKPLDPERLVGAVEALVAGHAKAAC